MFYLEDTMFAKRDWSRVAVVVVLALASLSSIALSAPHHDRPDVYPAPAADLCGQASLSRFDQYQAAIEWAEQGGTETPWVLSVSCVQESVDRTARDAGSGGESWARFEQYSAAIEGRDPALNAAPVPTATGSQARFEQYSAAIKWAQEGGPAPHALSANYGEDNLPSSRPFAGYGGESWARFEQYMAAIGQ
jgi:hypothetical protein